MNKVFCIKDYYGFEKGKTYNVISINSVFEDNDFITIDSGEEISHSWYRFRLNTSLAANDMIGENEINFYDYFCNIKEARKLKLEKIQQNINESFL
jgi:hypothetical protein